MSDQLQIHILERLDKIQDDVQHVRESQIRMEADVRYHIKRTDLLEDELKNVKSDVSWARWITGLFRWVAKKFKL